ncbi:MAG: maltokinase N-terminal cap-like domain-containing protein [Candidatus Dormibacteria bacterium]
MNATDLLAARGLADAARLVGEYVVRQRWYGGRQRGIREFTIDDSFELPGTWPAVVVVILAVHYDEGLVHRYQVPVAISDGGGAEIWEGNVVATVDIADRRNIFYDALSDGNGAWAFWRAIAEGARISTAHGEVVCAGDIDISSDGPGSVRPLAREQSNTSLVRADREVLKCFRRIELGTSPELEMLESLASVGFNHVAPVRGTIERIEHDGGRTLLAMVQRYLHNGTEGWTLALNSLRNLYADIEEAGAPQRSREEIVVAVREQGSSFGAEAQRIGGVTAELHLALCGPGMKGEMAAEAATTETLRAWVDEMSNDLADLLGHASEALQPLRDQREAILAVLRAPLDLEQGGMAIRYHGDYHLGQLLRTDDGWTILDFEGEPARGGEARRARSSALRDVAGMLRSFDYAAAVELRDFSTSGEPGWEVMQAHSDAWAELNRKAFWEAYIARVGDSPLLPKAADAVILRRAFEMQKAIYEVGYELGHRPDWAAIPIDFVLTEVGG